jgi:hypothetical protein
LAVASLKETWGLLSRFDCLYSDYITQGCPGVALAVAMSLRARCFFFPTHINPHISMGGPMRCIGTSKTICRFSVNHSSLCQNEFCLNMIHRAGIMMISPALRTQCHPPRLVSPFCTHGNMASIEGSSTVPLGLLQSAPHPFRLPQHITDSTRGQNLVACTAPPPCQKSN